MASADVARRLARTLPVVYLVFDVLHLDGRPTVDLPYDERRALLDGLGLAGRSWQTPPSFDGPGADVLAASRENGLEGVVAKLRTSPYLPGSRRPTGATCPRADDLGAGGGGAGSARPHRASRCPVRCSRTGRAPAVVRQASAPASAVIWLASPACCTSMRRGLASSATGMLSVSTPSV